MHQDAETREVTDLLVDSALDFAADLVGAPRYQLELMAGHRPRHRDRLDGVGRFHDLRQLSLFEGGRHSCRNS